MSASVCYDYQPATVSPCDVVRVDSRNAEPVRCTHCRQALTRREPIAVVPIPCCARYRCGRGRLLARWCSVCLQSYRPIWIDQGVRYVPRGYTVKPDHEAPCAECGRLMFYVEMRGRVWWPITCSDDCKRSRRQRLERARDARRRAHVVTTWRPCTRCGASFTGRTDARWCSSRCRQAAYRRRLDKTLSVGPPARGVAVSARIHRSEAPLPRVKRPAQRPAVIAQICAFTQNEAGEVEA